MSALADYQTKGTHPRVKPKGLEGIFFQAFNLLRNRKDYYYVNGEKARKLLGISLGLGEDGLQAPLPWFGFGLFLGASEAPFDFFDFEFCFFDNL